MSEIAVALGRYMHFHYQLLYRWNHHWKGEDIGHNAVHERMEVEYCCAWWRNHHPAVLRQICICSSHCGCDGGEWCKHRCRKTSSTGKDAFDEYHCVLATWCVTTSLRSVSTVPLRLTPLEARLSSENAAPLFTVSKQGSYHSGRIFLILLPTFATWSIALFFFNILWITKSIPHLHSARRADCQAPSQDSPTPVACFMGVILCQLRTICELCIPIRYRPSEIMAEYKRNSKDKRVRYDCRAQVELCLWWTA